MTRVLGGINTSLKTNAEGYYYYVHQYQCWGLLLCLLISMLEGYYCIYGHQMLRVIIQFTLSPMLGVIIVFSDTNCWGLLHPNFFSVHCNMLQKMQQDQNFWVLRCVNALLSCVPLEVSGVALKAPYNFPIHHYYSNLLTSTL